MTTHVVIKDGKEKVIEIPDLHVKQKKAKQAEPFAQMTLKLTAKAAEALGSPCMLVFAMLVHLAWKAKGQPFPFSNEVLKPYGVSREVKRETLATLEAAGIIKVERHRTRSPVVTLIGYVRHQSAVSHS
jgi:hypothetical protein